MSRLTRTSPLLPIGAADLVDADQRAEAFAQDQSIWEANRTSFGAGMSGFTTMELGRNIASSLYAVDPNWELTDVDLKGVTDGIDPDLWQFYDDAKSYKHLLYIYGRNQAVMDKRRTLAENGIRGFGGQLAAGLLDPGMLAAGAATGGLAGYIRGTGVAASAMRIGVGAAAGGVPQGALTAFQSSADPSISGKEVAKSFIGGAMFGGVSVGTATLGRGTRFLAGAAGQAAGPAAIDYATGTPLPDAMLELGTNLIFGGVFNSLHSSAAMKVAELPPDAPVVPDSPAPTKPPYDPYTGMSELDRLLHKEDLSRLGLSIDKSTAMVPPTNPGRDTPQIQTLDDILAAPVISDLDQLLSRPVAKSPPLPSKAARESWASDLSERLSVALSRLPDLAGESRADAETAAGLARAAADPLTALQNALRSEEFTDLQILLARQDVQDLIELDKSTAMVPPTNPGRDAPQIQTLDDILTSPPQNPDGAALLSGLLEGRFTTDPITPAAIQKMKPERRKRLAKATVAAAAAKPGGVDRLVKAIEKEAATKAIAATFDNAGRAMVGDAVVEAAAAEGRELTPAEKIRHAESVDDAKVESRVSAALEAVGSTTPKPAAVEKPADPPIPQPESTFRAYRFTRNGLFDRLAELRAESPQNKDAEVLADLAFSGGSEENIKGGDRSNSITKASGSPFVWKAGKDGRLPEEVRQMFEGTPFYKHFRVAKPGEVAGGEEFMFSAGPEGFVRLINDRYGAEVNRWDADFRRDLMAWAKDKVHGNPEALFIAQILDNLSESKAKVFDKNVAFAAADDIQPGHEFKISDTLYRVIEDEDGAKLIVDGPGFEPVEASALALIPYDRGSLRPTQISDNPFADVPDISPLSAAEATKLEGVYGSAEFVALVDPVEARRVLAEIEAGSPRVPSAEDAAHKKWLSEQVRDEAGETGDMVDDPPASDEASRLDRMLDEGLVEGEADDIGKQVDNILAGNTGPFEQLKTMAGKNPGGWQAKEVLAIEAEIARRGGKVPKPSTAKKLIGAADKVIAKAKANKAQRAKDIAEAKKKAKPGQRLGIDEFTPSIVDNAMIVAAQAFKAGVRAVEQIRVMVRELLGADNPEVEARAMEILKASTNDAGQYDEALFAKQVENAFSTMEPAKESGATDAVANVPATRTYNLDAHRSMFASGVPESINQTAEIKILGKNRRVSWWRFDIAGMLGKSKSPLMRMAGKVLAFDFMPSKDGSPSVVGLHESVGHNVAANEYAYEEAVKPAWLAHREEAKRAGTKPMNREEFEIAAGKAFRRGEDPTDPNIRSVRSAVRKMYDDLGQMLKDHGLDVGLLDNYLNRMWIRPAMDDAALRMGRAGKDPQTFADGDRAAGYAQLRERFADAILAKGTITDRDEAIRLAQTIIDHAGHTDSYDGDDGITTGYTSRLKERIDLDETYRWKLADGSEMGIEDLIESNLYTLFKNYNRAAHGSAALAEASRLFSAAPDLGTDRVNGIDSILTKIREDAMSVGLTAAEYSEDLDRVREALHLIAGLPSRTETGFTRMVDAVRSFQSFRLMANLGTGLLQVGEVIARTGELGPRVITNLFPAIREVITLARTGKMSSQQAREIAQMGIAVDRAASRIPRRAGESLGQPVGKSAAEWNLRRGARAAFDVAGISFLTDASRLAVMRTKQQQWAGWAYSGHLPSTRRLAIDTLSPEMAAKIVAEIRKPGRAAWVDKPGGLLDRYVWEKWPHDVRIAFQDSLRRNASRSILSVPDSAMPMVANSPVGKVFFQFRRMAVAAQATIGPELYARDGQMIRTLAASAAGGALIYIANTLLQSAGRRDRKAFLEERLELDMVLRAAFSRSLYSAFVPTAIDTLVSDIGRQEPVFSFSRTTGLQGGFLLGNPTIDWFDRMGFPKDPLRVPRAMLAPGIPHYDFSRQDLRAIQGTLVPNIVGLKNALDRWAEGLPDTSYED